MSNANNYAVSRPIHHFTTAVLKLGSAAHRPPPPKVSYINFKGIVNFDGEKKVKCYFHQPLIEVKRFIQ